MKKLYYLFLIAVFLTTCTGCNSNDAAPHAQSTNNYLAFSNAQPAQVDLGSLNGVPIDNNTPLEQATSYSLTQLQDFFGSYSFSEVGIYMNETSVIQDWQQTHSLVFTNEHLPTNILRYTQRQDSHKAYSIYRVNEGGFYYVFWNELANENSDIYAGESHYVMDYALYFNGFVDQANFLQLQVGQSNLENVCAIDSGSEITLTSSLTVCVSVHYLKNRLCAVAYYTPITLENLSNNQNRTRNRFQLTAISFHPIGEFGVMRYVLSTDIPSDWLEPIDTVSTINTAEKLSASQANLESNFNAVPLENSASNYQNFLTNNTVSLESTLTAAYPISNLQAFFNNDVCKPLADWEPLHTIYQVHTTFPIEIVRSVQSFRPMKYTVYRVQEGGYYYVFWEERSWDDQTLYPYATFYLNGFCNWDDFTSLVIGKSTMADFYTIDPIAKLEYWPEYEQYSTTSFLTDGLCITVLYTTPKSWDVSNSIADLPQQDFLVESIEISSVIAQTESSTLYLNAVLLQDLP